MFYKSIFIAVTALTVMTTSVHADDPIPSGGLSQQEALEFALLHNQGLAATRSQADALGNVPAQANALPDPMLGFNAINLPTDTFDLDQEPMTQMQVALSQTFPFPGQRGLRRDAAEHDASAATQGVLEQQLQIAAKVRGTWWQIAYLDQALEIIQQNQQLMRDFVEIALTKYKVGKGLQQDVLLAQLELSKLINRQLPLEGMRDAAETDLNALMDRPPSEPIRLAAKTENIGLPELPLQAELLENALDSRPRLDAERGNQGQHP